MRTPLLLLALTTSGCVSGGFDPARLPVDEPFLITVKSAALPGDGPLSLAQHGYFDLKRGSEDDWWRVEVNSTRAFRRDKKAVEIFPISSELARAQTRWSHDVHLVHVIEGSEAERIAAEIVDLARAYPDAWTYAGWPGPNSNTFVDRVARTVQGLAFEPNHNMIGKDFAWFLSAGPTTTGTGLQLETPFLGVQLGLEEGIELHVFQFTLGIDFWPPAIKLPGLPRLGFPN